MILPFSILGIKTLSGLALYGSNMFIQQKDDSYRPKQKLGLHDACFVHLFSQISFRLESVLFYVNLMSIGQQVWNEQFSSKSQPLEDLKKSPKKEFYSEEDTTGTGKLPNHRVKLCPAKNSPAPNKPNNTNTPTKS